MIENIKPVELLTVADLEAHPVWEYVNGDEFLDTLVRPAKEIPVESDFRKEIGAQVRLANGLQVWALIANVDATNPRIAEHCLALSIERGGKWFFLARYHDLDFATQGPEALARFLGLTVDDVFPISVDVRKYVQGDPAALAFVVLKEPRERLTRAELTALAVGKSSSISM
jgi:hypothetical protein